ncbi:MAG: flippase [Acidobacteriaceae bacterium]|nr:flippase [Acidobacteriaceae bacterium]
MEKRLAENIFSLAVVQALTYAAPFFTVPYLVRVLQPTNYGLLSFAQAIVLYCDFVTDYGFAFSATRAIVLHRHNPEDVSRIFWSTIFSKTVLMIGTGLALSLLVAFIPRLHQTPAVYAVCFLSVFGTTAFPVWLFQGLEQMKASAIALGAARFLTLPLLFAFVREPSHYVRAAAIQGSVELLAAVFLAPVIWRRLKIRWHRPSIAEVAESLRIAWPLFLSGAALFLCTSSTAVILGFVARREQVGYYTAAEKLIKACIAAFNPLGQALYPHIAAARTGSCLFALRLIRNSFWVTGGLAFAASIATFALARPVCGLVLGASFAPSSQLLRWMSPLPFLFGLMSVLGIQTMVVFELDSVMSRIMMAGACAGIPLTILLSRYLGPRGAAMASVIEAGGMVAAMAVALRVRGFPVWQRIASPGAATFAPGSQAWSGD